MSTAVITTTPVVYHYHEITLFSTSRSRRRDHYYCQLELHQVVVDLIPPFLLLLVHHATANDHDPAVLLDTISSCSLLCCRHLVAWRGGGVFRVVGFSYLLLAPLRQVHHDVIHSVMKIFARHLHLLLVILVNT
jgi:hypothetical protein